SSFVTSWQTSHPGSGAHCRRWSRRPDRLGPCRRARGRAARWPSPGHPWFSWHIQHELSDRGPSGGAIRSPVAGGRRARRKPYRAFSAIVLPPSFTIRRARAWAASTKTGSFKVTKAWRGVLVRGLVTVHTVRPGASKVIIEG